jgi:group II intron reverse transcriptase/maturase
MELNPKAAPGVDKVCWDDYKGDMTSNLFALEKKLHSGSYRPLPARRAYIPKGPNEKRPLGIVAIEDKIVQRAAAEILAAIYEVDFFGFSYGFRPGRSCHDALDALTVAIESKKVNWILDADIKGFFDSISHDRLMTCLERRIGDPRMLKLISAWLKAGVLEDGQWTNTETGTPQGGVISPLLANVFLHYVLDEWAHQWRTEHAKGDVIIVRYADDFVMGFQYQGEAIRFLELLRDRLKEFGLALHPDKTRLIEFGRFAASNRKRRGQGKPETFDFLGFTHYCSLSQKGRYRVKRKTAAKRMRKKLTSLKDELRKRINWKLEVVALWLQQVVRGYYNYYAIHDNLHVLGIFRYQLGKIWYRTICRRSQKRSMTWKQFIDRWWWRIPAPKALHPYPQERFYDKYPKRSPVR